MRELKCSALSFEEPIAKVGTT